MARMAISGEDEQERIAAVRRYDVLDTPPDQAFDRIAALAARTCNAPVAIVSIVDTERIWFKSRYGVDVEQIGRDPGLCASAILQNEPWIVEDARADARTFTNPLVAGDFGLQFYLGIPLRTSDGYNLGTLCVLDFEPRPATEREILDLTDLASVVVDELELRLAAAREVAMEAKLRSDAEDLARHLQISLVPAQLPHLAALELAAEYLPAHRERVGGDFYDAFETLDGYGLLVGDVCGHGPRAAALATMARHTLRTLTTSTDWSPTRVLAELNTAMIRAAIDDGRPCTAALLRCTPDRSGGITVTVALGGHPHPRLLRSNGNVEIIGARGSLVGTFASAAFTDVDVHLSIGDAVVLYTDGLTESGGSSNRFDDGRLDQILATLGGAAPATIVDALVTAVADSNGVPRDDIAILVAHCTSPV